MMAFTTFCLAVYETYLIIVFMGKVFRAQDIDDFKNLGTRSIGAEEVLDFYKFHSKGEMNPKKIKRMEKYFHKALKKKKKIDKVKSKHKSIIHPSEEKYNKMRRKNKQNKVIYPQMSIGMHELAIHDESAYDGLVRPYE